jgi:hypothetical protein
MEVMFYLRLKVEVEQIKGREIAHQTEKKVQED